MAEPSQHYLLVNTESALLLKRCVDLYLERWPGGDPAEQLTLYHAQTTLNAIILENPLLK